MGDLKQWAKDTNPNLKLEDGETVVGIYQGYAIVDDAFNPGKEKVQYELQIDGKTKYWKSGSGAVAMFFDQVPKGGKVKITASGEGMKRRYDVEKVE